MTISYDEIIEYIENGDLEGLTKSLNLLDVLERQEFLAKSIASALGENKIELVAVLHVTANMVFAAEEEFKVVLEKSGKYVVEKGDLDFNMFMERVAQVQKFIEEQGSEEKFVDEHYSKEDKEELENLLFNHVTDEAMILYNLNKSKYLEIVKDFPTIIDKLFLKYDKENLGIKVYKELIEYLEKNEIDYQKGEIFVHLAFNSSIELIKEFIDLGCDVNYKSELIGSIVANLLSGNIDPEYTKNSLNIYILISEIIVDVERVIEITKFLINNGFEFKGFEDVAKEKIFSNLNIMNADNEFALNKIKEFFVAYPNIEQELLNLRQEYIDMQHIYKAQAVNRIIRTAKGDVKAGNPVNVVRDILAKGTGGRIVPEEICRKILNFVVDDPREDGQLSNYIKVILDRKPLTREEYLKELNGMNTEVREDSYGRGS